MTAIACTRLFLVTATGQVTNALNMMRNAGAPLEAAHFVIVFTTRAPQITEMERLLSEQGAAFTALRMPGQPNSGRFGVIRRCFRFYGRLLDDAEFEELWIANSNSHYAVFAQMCRDRGKRVFFYEEGLGTYRTYAQLTEGAAAGVAFRAMMQGLWAETKRFLNAVRNHLLNFVFSLNVTRSIGRRLLPWPMKRYFGVFTEFDGIVVRHPEMLDPQAFKGPVTVLPFMPENYALSQTERARLALRDDAPRRTATLFVSQRYSTDLTVWNAMLAEEIAQAAEGALFVKFHPRERQEEKAALLAALAAQGVDACDIDPTNTVDALKIISGIGFTRILGLTSTVLLHAHDLSPTAAVHSLAPGLVARARAARCCQAESARVARDFGLLARFPAFAQGGTGQAAAAPASAGRLETHRQDRH